MASLDLLDTAGVAELAGLPPATIRTYLHRGAIPEPDFRAGRSPVWRRKTIEKWLATRPVRGQHAKKGTKK